jgi:hypothetical protein
LQPVVEGSEFARAVVKSGDAIGTGRTRQIHWTALCGTRHLTFRNG